MIPAEELIIITKKKKPLLTSHKRGSIGPRRQGTGRRTNRSRKRLHPTIEATQTHAYKHKKKRLTTNRQQQEQALTQSLIRIRIERRERRRGTTPSPAMRRPSLSSIRIRVRGGHNTSTFPEAERSNATEGPATGSPSEKEVEDNEEPTTAARFEGLAMGPATSSSSSPPRPTNRCAKGSTHRNKEYQTSHHITSQLKDERQQLTNRTQRR